MAEDSRFAAQRKERIESLSPLIKRECVSTTFSLQFLNNLHSCRVNNLNHALVSDCTVDLSALRIEPDDIGRASYLNLCLLHTGTEVKRDELRRIAGNKTAV